MRNINIYEAKTQFSRLVDAAARGEEVVIARAGKPAARLVAYESRMPRKIRYGFLKGKIRIARDFDAPLPDDLLAAFEGRP